MTSSRPSQREGMSVLDDRAFEWLTQRLDRQDYMLDAILKEQRKTNGRLLDHEGRLKAVEDDQAADARAEMREEERRVRRTDLWQRRVEVTIGALCVLLAGAEGDRLIHLIFG